MDLPGFRSQESPGAFERELQQALLTPRMPRSEEIRDFFRTEGGLSMTPTLIQEYTIIIIIIIIIIMITVSICYYYYFY